MMLLEIRKNDRCFVLATSEQRSFFLLTRNKIVQFSQILLYAQESLHEYSFRVWDR